MYVYKYKYESKWRKCLNKWNKCLLNFLLRRIWTFIPRVLGGTLNNERNQGKNIGVEGLIFTQLGGGIWEKFSLNVTGQLTL